MRNIRVKSPSLFIKTSQCYLNQDGILTQQCECRLGQKGVIEQNLGREGDKKTPLGRYSLRFGLYRPDRLPPPPSPLNFWPLRPDDAWCDAAQDPAYNRFIRLPYAASHETLWREDSAYDIILVMSHNDSPPQRHIDGTGRGSAVFIHIAQSDDRKTLGCIALTPPDIVRLLPHLFTDMVVEINR